ncbi:MAG TPA: UUP1 family membrane protein, partial [Burkholderiales bacterium]|nr:UUP1 family membrane protein [Burkholderiales bacterium]
MKRAHLYVLAAALTAIALAIFLYKYVVFGFPLAPEERTEIWRVEVRLQFEAEKGPVKAAMFIPSRTGRLIIVDQSFVSPGYGITTEPQPGQGIKAAYSIRDATGLQAVYYRAVIQPSRVAEQEARDSTPKLAPPELQGPRLAAAQAVIESARRQSSDASTLAAIIVKLLKTARPESEESFLLGPQPTNRRLVVV